MISIKSFHNLKVLSIKNEFQLTGIVLSAVWLLAVVIMEKKKRKVWLIAGAVISLLMLLYTQQWKLFLWGIAGGIVGGSGLVGKRLDRIREFHAENGILHTILIFIIFFELVFMSMAVSTPGLIVE